MSDFSPSVINVFWTRLGAEFYAWRARRRGFTTSISDYGANCDRWLLGGRYGVLLKAK